MRAFLFCGAAMLAFVGCAEKRLPPRADLTMMGPGSLPPPTTADLIQPARSYLIGPLDKVMIEVYGLPDLSRSIQVDASGYVSLPLVGPIKASGKTPIELSKTYAEGLKSKYVRDPSVTVNLTETVSQNMAIGGAVGSPGIYPVTGRMTLMRAIDRASGITEFAKEREVVVYRRVGNRDMAALYDLRAIRAGAYEDPEIYANDVIEIGESRGRRIFKDIVSLAPILSAPLIAVLNR